MLKCSKNAKLPGGLGPEITSLMPEKRGSITYAPQETYVSLWYEET